MDVEAEEEAAEEEEEEADEPDEEDEEEEEEVEWTWEFGSKAAVVENGHDDDWGCCC